MSNYRSFQEQSGHYFGRPHDAVPEKPVECEAAWRGDVMEGDPSWRVALSSDAVREIENAIDTALATNKPTGELVRQDFPLEIVFHIFRQWHILRVSQTAVRLRLPFSLALGFLHDFAFGIAFRAFDRDRLVAEVGVVEDTADGSCGGTGG